MAKGYDPEADGLLHESRPDRPRASQSANFQRYLLLALASCLSLLLGLAIGLNLHGTPGDLDRACFDHTSNASPLLQDIDITWHEVSFNGSLLKADIYRQSAGPEVDAAWEGLGVNYSSFLVPPEQAASAGLSKDQVKVREKYGGGYVANVKGLHHLHCLNLLRQALYWNIEYYRARGEGAFANEESIVRKHVTHCLDILRQQLMCSIDVGVMGQVWIQPSPARLPEAFVDFNTKHLCRNFEDVREWAYKHHIHEPTPRDFLQPPRSGDRIFSEIP